MGARNFTGNSQYIIGSQGVANCPATFAAWYQPLNVASGQETVVSCRNLVSGRGIRNFGVWSLDSSAKIVCSGVNNNGNLFTARGTIMPIAQWNSTIVGSGLCIFLAATTADAGANWIFYYRFASEEDLTLPTSTDNGGVACPGGELVVGAELTGAGPGIGNSCLGKLGQVGVWNVVLSSSQLNAWSNGTSSSLTNAYCAMPIEGVDPETNLGTLAPVNSMDVVGDPTFVEVGCVPSGDVFPPGNPPIPKTPNFSGGPGGGFQVPTLDFGDGGPHPLSPMVSNARSLPEPNFGSMGIAGPRGGKRSPKLGQRSASMFRNQEHLYAWTRKRK